MWISVFFFSLASLALAQNHPPLHDGLPHGDPPFRIEPGWRNLINNKNLTGWKTYGTLPNQWMVTSAIRWEPVLAPEKLFAFPTGGDTLFNGEAGKSANLFTEEKFGDVELYLEYLVPKGSNSGVYLHGLYEVQIFDSFGKAEMQYSDAGGIYHQWIDGKGVGGSAPRVNASRRPGEWQSFQIWFRAPRFDAAGKKVENARFVQVLHNGVLVQKEVAVAGPTRAHMPIEEASENPLMLQGDHGPVAFRNIYIRPLRPIVPR